MRIIGGRFKGRSLVLPKGIRVTRPLVKKSIFDSIASFNYSAVLDLCAGSGSLGIEALSRGADHAVFIEKNRSVAKTLHNNIMRLGLEDESEVLIGDVRSILKGMQMKFDLIFIDPPYRTNLATKLLGLICKHSILDDGGMVVVESSKHNQPQIDKLDVVDCRSIGETMITYLRGRE